MCALCIFRDSLLTDQFLADLFETCSFSNFTEVSDKCFESTVSIPVYGPVLAYLTSQCHHSMYEAVNYFPGAVFKNKQTFAT